KPHHIPCTPIDALTTCAPIVASLLRDPIIRTATGSLIIKARDLSKLGAVLSRSSPSSVRSDLRHPWPLRTASSPTMAPMARPPHASPPSTVRCRPAVSTTPSLSPPSSRAPSSWWMAPRAPPPETQVAADLVYR
ncbi:hypothetical protein BHM03_00046514, partial [Ensete ventricosum]